MDIDLLSKMIGELILDHDELSLPGLGTFVAEEVPATFSDKGYTVNPPYRKLSFYQRPENDHLLVDFYAGSNNLSFEEASLIIVRFLDEMKSVLKEKKVIVMPGLGRLRATRENNFFFVPDADLDIYPDGFGLRPVSMKNHTESQAELSDAVGKLSGMLFEAPADEPSPQPEVQPVPASEPSSQSEVQPVPASEPSPQPESESVTAAEPSAASNEVPETSSESVTAPKRPKQLAGGLKVLIVIVVLLALALAVYLILARVAPGFVDSLLYSPEELEILNYSLQ